MSSIDVEVEIDSEPEENENQVCRQFCLLTLALVFMCLQHKSFENTVAKGEIIAHNEQFFLFPECFPSFKRTEHHFHQI